MGDRAMEAPHPASCRPHPSLRATLSHPMGERHCPGQTVSGHKPDATPCSARLPQRSRFSAALATLFCLNFRRLGDRWSHFLDNPVLLARNQTWVHHGSKAVCVKGISFRHGSTSFWHGSTSRRHGRTSFCDETNSFYHGSNSFDDESTSFDHGGTSRHHESTSGCDKTFSFWHKSFSFCAAVFPARNEAGAGGFEPPVCLIQFAQPVGKLGWHKPC